MSKNIKKSILISIIVVLIIIAIISTFFIIKYFQNKSKINTVLDIYSNENVQERIDNESTTSEANLTDNLMLKIDGETVLGVIDIDRIQYQGLIYEGTSLSTLAKGVGHFTNSPYLYGNVCLAAHNTNKFWAKLHTLQNGDKITYTSFLGTKQYEVDKISTIYETDWSNLANTDENVLTLITCIKGQKDKRLCVRAKEI
ncbi:MAG: sortase [Clostridia bacterium]|nr:sortase [Clostridia bacterium]